MLKIVCKSILSYARTSKTHTFFIPPLHEFSSSATNANKPISKPLNQEPFTVQYLMHQFGFSLEKSVSASKHVQFQSSDKPDTVVTFLKNHGFNETQIRKVISSDTGVLNSNTEKTLLPKFDFLRSKGASPTDLAQIITFNTNLLARSLKDHILPSFKYFRTYIGSDEGVIRMLKRNSRLLTRIENHVHPNIEILFAAGVPRSRIVFLLKHRPSLFVCVSDRLKESLEELRKMGMDPESCNYSLALSIMTLAPRSKWNEKMEAYKRWGCSEEEVIASFKMVPDIMSLSKEKVDGVMSFCVKEMAWEPSEVVRRYYLLPLSLNKRVIPRWSVYQELVSKRLVKDEGKLTTMFKMKEDLFLKKYVNCYEDEAPSLLKLYLEKLEASK